MVVVEAEDDRCPFGLQMTHNHKCDSNETYAKFLYLPYTTLRVTCFMFGGISLLLCARKLFHLRRIGGSSIQHNVYILLIIASLAIAVGAVDPWSYDYMYSPFVSGLLSDICSASIYTVMILYAAFYARLVVNPNEIVQQEFIIQGYMWLAIFLTWISFGLIRPIYLLSQPSSHNFEAWHILMQYSIAPLLLLLISSTALHFGLQVYQRLKYIDEANKQAMTIELARQQAKSPSAIPHPIVLDEPDMSPKSGIDTRILRVLILMEFYSIVVVGFQIWRLVDFVAMNHCLLSKEDACSRHSSKCNFEMDIPFTHVLQFCGIVLIYWSFRKTRHHLDLPMTNDPLTSPASSLSVNLISARERKVENISESSDSLALMMSSK